jgi:SAM-dependent methyltransferase
MAESVKPIDQEGPLSQLFDKTEEDIRSGNVFAAMEHLDRALGIHRSAGGPRWSEQARALYLGHRLRETLSLEPVTQTASDRPRGYAGDAGLLDYIYQACPLPDGITELGRSLHRWGLQTPAQTSVRVRRDFLSDYIDRAAKQVGPAVEILSLACGHFREGHDSETIQSRRFGRCVCLDQDELSLALVQREFGPLGVEVEHGSVRRLAFGRQTLGAFDVIYSAGLYDYLVDSFATRLTDALFGMLKPGGRLLLANFAPTLRDIGYMEVVMDWRLIYRTTQEMQSLCAGVLSGGTSRCSSFSLADDNLTFVELTRTA